MADNKTAYEKLMARFAGDVEPVTYDLGFAPPEVPDTYTQLGVAGMGLDSVNDTIKAQLETHLARAQTATAMTQTAINSQLYDAMQRAQANLRSVQSPIETQVAAQMGKAFEVANQVAPDDSIVRAVVGPQTTPEQQEFNTAALKAQYQMLSMDKPPPIAGGIGTSQQPQLPPGGVSTTNPGTPTQPTPRFDNIDDANRWVCEYNPWEHQPGSNGVNGLIEVMRVTSNGSTYIWYWDYGTSVPPYVLPKGSMGGHLIIAGPNGVAAAARPSNCGPTQTPPKPPEIPNTPIPEAPKEECPKCPDPVPCPPPPKQDCIKICKDEPAEPCKETEYEVYCSGGGLLYIVKKGAPPRSSSDKRVASGSGTGLNLSSIVKECKEKDKTEPGSGGVASPLPFTPIAGCDGLVVGMGITPPSDGKYLEHLLKLSTSPGTPSYSTGNPAFDALISFLGTGVGKPIIDAVDTVIDGFTKWLSSEACGAPRNVAAVGAKAVAGLLSRIFGRQTDPIETIAEYAYNSSCPYKLPTTDEATRAYLTNSIDLQRLVCIAQANGHRWDTWSQVVDSARSRLNVQETLVAWKRGIATDEWAAENLRQLGYLEGPETEILRMLTDQIPPMSDLITMMMRDVADETNVDWREADALFGEKWTGQLKEWGKQQGVPDLYAKYIWRAHFTIPSPTQLFEFWRRLRHTGFLGSLEETRKKIKDALIQQDIAPQWIDAFLQVAHQPLTRVDTRRAYEIGTITERDVYDSYIDQGYSDENAERLTKFAKSQQIERAKRSPLIRRYASGELTFDDLVLELESAGFSSEMIDVATSKAQRELRYYRRKKCLAGMKKRYMLGELKWVDIRDKIQSEGIDPSQAEEIAKAWECERSAKGKTVAASTLCEWYTQGLISDVEMYTRLLNLGYEQDDAARLVQSCRVRLGLKIQKDQQKALAQAKKLAEQQARQAAQTSANLQREVERVARANQKRSDTKKRRQRLLLEAAQKYGNRVGVSFADAAIGIQAAVDSLVASGLVDTDTAYQTAVVASVSEECTSFDCLSVLMGNLIATEAMVLDT